MAATVLRHQASVEARVSRLPRRLGAGLMYRVLRHVEMESYAARAKAVRRGGLSCPPAPRAVLSALSAGAQNDPLLQGFAVTKNALAGLATFIEPAVPVLFERPSPP